MSDPLNPALLAEVFDGDGTFNQLGGAFSVFVLGATAYIASFHDFSLTIIDVGGPALLVEGDASIAGGLDVTGDVSISGLITADPAQAHNLLAADAELLDGMDSYAFAGALHDHDATYYTEMELNTSGGGGAVHWDNVIEKPAMIGDGHSLDAQDGDPIDAVFVDAEGNTGIGTTAPTAGLHVSKRGPGIGDPELLAEIYDGDGTFSRLAVARGVFVSGTTAYVPSSGAGPTSFDESLTLIDVSDPMNPVLLAEIYDGDGTFSRLAGAYTVFVSGTTAYVASRGDSSLTIIDVSDPMNPALLAEVYDEDGTFSRLDQATSVYISGITAYVTSFEADSLTIIDVGGPALLVEGDASIAGNLGVHTTAQSNPFEVGTDATNGNAAHVIAGGVWTNGSDRNSKPDFEQVDRREILERVAGLPVTQWRYKGEPESVSPFPAVQSLEVPVFEEICIFRVKVCTTF